MWGGYWSPLQTMYGYGTVRLIYHDQKNWLMCKCIKMMSPYYAGGLGIPYMMGMGGLGWSSPHFL